MTATATATAPAKKEIAEHSKQQVQQKQYTYSIDTKKLNSLTESSEKYNLLAISGRPAIEQSMILAEGVSVLRKQVKEMMPTFMPLIGTELGFTTDKDKETDKSKLYGEDVLVECIATALLKGFRLINNEWMIISGRFYGRKNGYKRLCQEFPGITDMDVIPSVPKIMQGGAMIHMQVRYRLDGVLKNMERDFAVRLNAGQGADAAVGKGERKIYAALHGFLTGSDHTDADDDGPLESLASRAEAQRGTDALTDKLKNQQTPGAANGQSKPAEPAKAPVKESEQVLFPSENQQ